jgi:hypothetical protein
MVLERRVRQVSERCKGRDQAQVETRCHAASLRSPSQSARSPTTWFQRGILFAILKSVANVFWKLTVALGIVGIGLTIWGLATGAPVLGDRFFDVRGTVADCVSGERLGGVSIRVELLRGFGEEPYSVESKPNGAFHVHLNEPPSSAAELSFSAVGYQTRSEVFDPAPARGTTVSVCLERVH